MKHEYDHGQPFSEKLTQNLLDADDRVRKNKASLIIIDGFVGEGKTTLAVEIADYLNSIHGYPQIKLEEQLGIGGEEFQEKLRIAYQNQYHCCIYDEAGDFNKRGSLTKFNAAINRTFETYRAFQVLPILCLPIFDSLDRGLLDKGIPRMLIHVSKRSQTQGNFSVYSLYRMFYLLKKMQKITVKPQAYDQVEPNFRGHFLNLPPKRSAELDTYSTRGKLIILQKKELETAGLYNVQTISMKTGRSVSRLRALIRKLKMQPQKIIKKRKFYNQDQLDRLIRYIEGQPGHSWKK